MDKKKYKINIMLIISMISIIVIASFLLLKYEDSILNKYDADENENRELILLFHKIPDEEDLDMLFKDYKGAVYIKKHFEDFVLISVSDNKVCRKITDYLENHPLIKSVEPNTAIYLMQYTNDSYSSAQWPIYNPGYYSVYSANSKREVTSLYDMDMDVSEAWVFMEQEAAKRKEVVVAIIDTGVDYTHPDLAEHIWINPNEIPDDGIDNDLNGYVDDIHGWDFYNDDASIGHYKFDNNTKLNLALPEDNDDHGTHIAGIIGAVADNGMGIAGIASNIDIKLMVLKINGGVDGTGSISDAVLAIKYATEMGADICNISWGTTQYSKVLEETIKDSDMLFVAAAGNLGKDNDTRPVYPAGFMLDNLISVTFVDANGRITRLSNYGKNSVEIAAPGVDIMSTVVGTYQTLSGSSMAAPHVSAVASLLYSYDKNLYPQAVKEIIIKTLKPISGLENYVLYPGIPNAYKAVQEVNNIQEDMIPPVINIEVIYDKEDIMISVNAVDEGGSELRVIRWLAGRRKISDFNRGTTGLAVEKNQIRLSKAGEYTIYAADYAGNESLQTYVIEDDTSPPIISYNYFISEDYNNREVYIKVIDNKSGIRRVKYLPGKRKTSDFLPAGSGVELELTAGKSSFNVKNDGIYTLYAIDNRGNQSVKQIEVKTVLSQDIKFTQKERTLYVGEESYLRAFVKPADTTDIITYTSSDRSVVTINNKGKVTAIKEGTVSITARTNNGLKTVCRIIVKKTTP